MTAPGIQSRSAVNNFDLIRLFAATEVAIGHTTLHLNWHISGFGLLYYFPGVPIFFFISGFLIYQSFANINHNRYKVFFANRFLRLYPALLFCFSLSLFTLFVSGYLKSQNYELRELALWVVAQISFFQFYNPDFLRGFGVGVVNGSLWTIAVELQFYLLTPMLFVLFAEKRKLWLIILSIFIVANAVNSVYNDRSNILWKIFGVSFIPWFYMFMLGAYLSTDKRLQEKILSVNVLVYLSLYLISYWLAGRVGAGTDNKINVISYTLLCLLVFRLAYTRPHLSRKLLGGNDISYGIYIYHMPVVNFLLYFGIKETGTSFATAIAVSSLIAIFSWFVIEKPSLKLKYVALRTYC